MTKPHRPGGFHPGTPAVGVAGLTGLDVHQPIIALHKTFGRQADDIWPRETKVAVEFEFRAVLPRFVERNGALNLFVQILAK
jgi:hypothetical protein